MFDHWNRFVEETLKGKPNGQCSKGSEKRLSPGVVSEEQREGKGTAGKILGEKSGET